MNETSKNQEEINLHELCCDLNGSYYLREHYPESWEESRRWYKYHGINWVEVKCVHNSNTVIVKIEFFEHYNKKNIRLEFFKKDVPDIYWWKGVFSPELYKILPKPPATYTIPSKK